VTLDQSCLQDRVHLDTVLHHHLLHLCGALAVAALHAGVQQTPVRYIIGTDVLLFEKRVENLKGLLQVTSVTLSLDEDSERNARWNYLALQHRVLGFFGLFDILELDATVDQTVEEDLIRIESFVGEVIEQRKCFLQRLLPVCYLLTVFDAFDKS